ncbi:MAG: C25 family cysteine peptidase [Candidatus Eiseniibacteriota bacterium]
MPISIRTLRGALGAALLAWSATQARAAPTWIALDSAPAGSAPTIVLDANLSSPQQTVLDITVHGFWMEPFTRGTLTYHRLSLGRTPRSGDYGAVGRPELPALRHLLGALVDTVVGVPTVTVIAEVPLTGFRVYPRPAFVTYNGPPQPFQWDSAFYASTSSPYPAARAAALGRLGRLAGLEIVGAETYPLRAVPASGVLIAMRHYRVAIPHPGSGTPASATISRRRAREYQSLIDNYAVVSPFRPERLTDYRGDYLFVCPPEFMEEIQPLVEQKHRRGYEVTVVAADTIASGCAGLEARVDAWYAVHRDHDHYALLVGDAPLVESCLGSCFTTSERVIADVEEPGPFGEVRLGRLPCSSEAECADMIDKTLNYQENFPGWTVSRVVVASQADEVDVGEDEPIPFEQHAELLDVEGYEPAPAFVKEYASAGATNASVRDELDAGAGLLFYFGHGEAEFWHQWNGTNFDADEVALLDNGSRTPVAFHMACLTHDFAHDVDSVGEAWVKTSRRVVASCGSTGRLFAGFLPVFAPAIMGALYDESAVLLGEAIEIAIDEYVSHGEIVRDVPCSDEFVSRWTDETNPEMMVLLGDPDLEVWREAPDGLFLAGYPPEIAPGPGPIEVQVLGPGSAARAGSAEEGTQPVAFAIVTLYKPGDVHASRYTNASGIATFTVSPTTPGWMYLTVHTETDGRGVARDSILVTGAVGVPLGAGAGVATLAPPSPNPSAARVLLAFALPTASPARLDVLDLAGRRVAALAEGPHAAGRQVVEWDGRDARGTPVAAGLYLVRLQHRGGTLVRRLAIIK